jgi:hypothetical protein
MNSHMKIWLNLRGADAEVAREWLRHSTLSPPSSRRRNGGRRGLGNGRGLCLQKASGYLSFLLTQKTVQRLSHSSSLVFAQVEDFQVVPETKLLWTKPHSGWQRAGVSMSNTVHKT